VKGFLHQLAAILPVRGVRSGARHDHLMHQMVTRGFRNIFCGAVVVFIFALLQVFLFQRICNRGMLAANKLEYQGLPNLNHLADLREQLVLFRLYSYEYLFARENKRPGLEQAAHLARQRIYLELEEIKQLPDASQGQHLATTMEQTVTELAQAFDHMNRLTAQDFASAMVFLDQELPPKIQAVSDAAEALDRFGYQLSDAQAKANFVSFDGIKSRAYLLGSANIAAALGLVLFVLLASNKTHQQLACTLAQIQDQARKLGLQSSALNSVGNAVVITNPEGIIEWANPAFTRLTGYGIAEVAGKSPRVLKSGEHPPEFYATMWRTIEAGGVWSGELVNRRKDGSLYHEEMVITPVRGVEGSIQNFVAIKHDISHRIQFQRALESEKKLLCAIMDNLPDSIYFKDLESRFTRINLAQMRHLGLSSPEAALGKTDADFMPGHEAQQKRVDEQRMLVTGEPIIGLVERSDTSAGNHWVSSTKVPLRDDTGKVTGMVGISRDITAYRQMELERLEMQSRYRMLFDSSVEAILIADEKAVLDCNPATLKLFHCADKAEIVFRHPAELSPPRQPDGTDSLAAINQHITEAFNRKIIQTEYVFQRREGETFPAAITLIEFQQGNQRLLQATLQDLTEIKQAEKERQWMEVQLRQSQKLESIGQLAAGIAHEINTPTQYIGDNTRFLKDAFGSVVEMLRDYDRLLAAAKSAPLSPGQIAQLETAMVGRDMEFLYGQIPAAIQETLEGVERVSKIVRAMKEFSHPGGKEKTPSDLNKAIETTTTVARNEWKYVADLELRLAPDLPSVPCFLGEFNQVILNLVVNAAHAVGDVVRARPGSKGKITVSTKRLGEQVEIRVADTGTGIEEKHRAKIFEPFFTTKDVGKGTGQGLTVVYSNIVKKHGGTVTFETEVGRGTTFILRLPINPPPLIPP